MKHSEHKQKKYQADISSYFEKRSDNATAISSPPLPPDTQASLLNVGMRVRKSVPEGYKTHKTIQTCHQVILSSQPVPGQELLPFSGIHKVGGYKQQWSSSAPELQRPSLQTSSSFTTSQSTMSSQSTLSRKRSYEEEIEETMDMVFEEMDQEMSRKIAQPKSFNRRQRMLQLLDAEDFVEAHFLQPDDDIEMNDEYT